MPADPTEALRRLLPTHRDFFGRPIRSAPPELWRQLVKELERLPAGPARDQLLARSEAVLAGWPDELRVGTYEVETRLKAREMPVVWPLIRALRVSGKEMRGLLEGSALTRITILELSIGGGDESCQQAVEELTALGAATGVGAVRSLTIMLPPCAGPEVVAGLAGLRNFLAVRRLVLPRVIGPDNAIALAKIPWLAQLDELDLRTSKPRASGLVALGQSPHLQGLRVLRLRGSLDRFIDLRGLATRSGWAGLRVLDLASNPVDDAGLRALGGSHALRRLTELDLSSLGMDPQELASLIAGGGLPALAVLRLTGNAFGDRGAMKLAAVKRWSGLRELWLARTAIGPEGLRSLASAPHLQQLEVLDLGGNKLGVTGGQVLAGASLTGLRHLDLSRCGVDEASLVALLARLTAPERLLLANNGIGDIGAREIAVHTEWTGLRELDVRDGNIGASGMVALASAPQLAGLTHLEIGGNRPGEPGWRALVDSTALARFVTDEWRDRLATHDTKLSAADAVRRIPADFKLRVERHCVFGGCRRFTATIRASGEVDYSNAYPGDPPGLMHLRLDSVRMRLILVALDRMLPAVVGHLRLGEPACQSYIADLPPVLVDLRRDGEDLQLDSESFCNGTDVSQAMWGFADRLDALLTGASGP